MKLPTEVLLKIFDNLTCEKTAYNLWMNVIDKNQDPCLRESNFIKYLNEKRWNGECGQGLRVFTMPYNKNVTLPMVELLTARSMKFILNETDNWDLKFFASRLYNLWNECYARFKLISAGYNNLHDHVRVLHTDEEFEELELIWKFEMRIRMKKAFMYLDGLREFLECDLFSNSQLESMLYKTSGLVFRDSEEDYKKFLAEENEQAWWL
jgi:hypothetical protein